MEYISNYMKFKKLHISQNIFLQLLKNVKGIKISQWSLSQWLKGEITKYASTIENFIEELAESPQKLNTWR